MGFRKLYPIKELFAPPEKEAAALAIVKHNASALSGDFIPRLLISSLLSIFNFPVDVYL